jgi:glycosyltransferase involved in cell wall biosynthesis
VNVLIWHHHGSWTTAFVQGAHTYLVPVVAGRGPDGRGRAATWRWPDQAREVTRAELAHIDVDVVVVQCPRDLRLARRWLGGRIPGRDVPLVWLEHNTPRSLLGDARHPMADRDDVVVVHVTHTNDRFWDTGRTRTVVIEHGVIDPGLRYRGDRGAAASVINEPLRRGRAVGADLLAGFASVGQLEVYGMDADLLPAHPAMRTIAGVDQAELHQRLAGARVYLHPYRWTSLGLALIEAMMIGMPVVALATTEVPAAVPSDAGVVSNDLERLHRAVAGYLADPELAAATGRRARASALERFSLDRFGADWDLLLKEVTS